MGEYPISELIKDPKTGKILKLSELYQGNVVEATYEELAQYDMRPQSGTIKNVDGKIVSLVDLILEGRRVNSSIIKSKTRPTDYEVDKTIWVREGVSYSVDENSFREITIEDLNVIPLNGASNFRIDSFAEKQDPISELKIMWDYLDIKAKVDATNEFTRQNVLINTKNTTCLKIMDAHKNSSGNMGYITPCINLDANKTVKLYINSNGNNKLYINDFNVLDSYGLATGTKILEVPSTIGKQEFYYVWFEEETQEVVIQGKDGKIQKLSTANEEGLRFTKFNGFYNIINRTEESVYIPIYTYQRIGNVNKNLTSKTVTLLGENENFDVVLGSR